MRREEKREGREGRGKGELAPRDQGGIDTPVEMCNKLFNISNSLLVTFEASMPKSR